MEKQLKTLEDVLGFIKAGNARFTLRSVKTQGRYTYRVRPSTDGNVWFVSLMTGTDNESHYSYMGIIDKNNAFKWTAKSKVGQDAPGFKAFDWVWRRLAAGILPGEVEIWHEGHCGKCGRTLTVPESIDRGIGPECWKKTGAQSPQLPLSNEDKSDTDIVADDDVTLEMT